MALVVRNACRGAHLCRAMRWLGAGLVPSGNIQRLTLAAYEPPPTVWPRPTPLLGTCLPPLRRRGRGHLPARV